MSDANADETCHPMLRRDGQSLSSRKVRKRLTRQVRQAIDDYKMAAPGQRWLVCLSGGKDSYAMLALLLDLKWRGVLPIDLVACNLDQGQPGFPKHVLPEFLTTFDVPFHIEHQDTYSVVTAKVPENQTYCSLCSRLRRAHLYRVARSMDCDAIVLGHHSDDILETFFLNLFHGGKLATMPPKLRNDEGDLLVLRPMAYCSETDITKFADDMAFPIIPCDLCGSQDGLQRQVIKAMLSDWERTAPGRKRVMLRALSNARPSHLLDQKLFDFASLNPTANAAAARSEQNDADEETACGRVSDMLMALHTPHGGNA